LSTTSCTILHWHDIDFDRSTITIRRSLAEVGWDLQFTDVKTRTARRTINVSRQVLDALRRHREAAEESAAEGGDVFDPKGLVFAGPDGGPMLSRASQLFLGEIRPVLEQVVEALVEDLLAPAPLVEAGDRKPDEQIPQPSRVQHVGVQQRHRSRHAGQ
jgi:integrase